MSDAQKIQRMRALMIDSAFLISHERTRILASSKRNKERIAGILQKHIDDLRAMIDETAPMKPSEPGSWRKAGGILKPIDAPEVQP